ncbi:MAG: tetratricopeptide repeat protein, partial [Polyangiaceae bacterium]
MRFRASVLLFSVLWCGAARADDDVDDARKQFVEGVQRFQEGDFEGARAAFGRAEAEHHSAVIVYNLARTEERLGHPQAAIEDYEAYLAEGGDAAEYGPAAALAIAQIKGRSPRVRIETSPPGTRIFVDGTPITERSPTTLLVPVGHHHVVVEGDGWRGEVDLDAVETAHVVSVTIARPPLPPKAYVPPALPV